ncbi:DegT/DnrJ/EryC1/StrS family aminotransferase, partial [candidate division WWE3 bacterium]|nr:DegT/DnrJ/EryC1/StrS family aminotransferase [candidate division WWE3 bacterium]
MEKIIVVAKKHGLLVIEDCAQSFGATIAGRHVGLWGDVGCVSFYPTKNLGGFGDGGAVFSDNQALVEKVRQLRMYGEIHRYESITEGTNSRMDELQAGFVRWGLLHIDEWNKTRSDIAQTYIKSIHNALVQLPVDLDTESHRAWHLFVVRVSDRTAFTRHLEENCIGYAIHYPKLVYDQPAYEFLRVDSEHLPVSTSSVGTVVSLPLYPELTEEEVYKVIEAVNSYGK